MADVPDLLRQIAAGDRQAAAALYESVYAELRRLAERLLASEQPGQTLQATALVNEAYLKLFRSPAPPSFENHRHFFAAATNAMRQILVEVARRKATQKRAGPRRRLDILPDDLAAPAASIDVLDVHDALTRLAATEPRVAELVQLRFFGGLALKEAATVLGISERTAQLDWSYARAWLLDALQARGEPT